MNKAYNYEFKMFMEGIEVPFRGANITCTPNGVEANINLESNKELLEIHPKTAVQIFFKEWTGTDKPAWRLMFDGFFSSFYKIDQAASGRDIGITCRDFRMDIRRAPACLAYLGNDQLTVQNYYSITGLYDSFVVPGNNKNNGKTTIENTKRADMFKARIQKAQKVSTRVYDTTGLSDLAYVFLLQAGTAIGKSNTAIQMDTNYKRFYEVFPLSPEPSQNKQNLIDGGFVLDAIVRGIWTEAVGGSSLGEFLNKRIRMDKRLLTLRNFNGFRMWKRASFGLEVASYMMGDSMFTSIEAAIMRLAGLFNCRVYSCNTPSLINVSKKEDKYLYVMSALVQDFLVDKNSESFGAPFILNESMLIPPLEFTAPPDCNIFFPPMYNRLTWQHDWDVDYTRCYFTTVDSWSTYGGADLGKKIHQIPTALFHTGGGSTNPKDVLDENGRKKLPLTLEERYKGVNVLNSTIEYNLAASDQNKNFTEALLKEKAKASIDKKIADLTQKKKDLESKMEAAEKLWQQESLTKNELDQVNKDLQDPSTGKAAIKQISDQIANSKSKGNFLIDNALHRHALIKFINNKFNGRTIQINMTFNPYPVCGFPGLVVADKSPYGDVSMKSVFGMVQQVQHYITVTISGAEATTSIVMNNARMEDEPTDMDRYGLPLYMKPTDRIAANINKETLLYTNNGYFIPDAVPTYENDLENKLFDLKETNEGVTKKDYPYVKDFISLSAKQIDNGEMNNTYLDRDYEPQMISIFYKKIFNQHEHFMVGRNGNDWFMFDTMHEAVQNLRTNRPELLVDYEACMSYIKRNICSAEGFFKCIVGASNIQFVDANAEFINHQVDYNETTIDDTIIYDAYYGITNYQYLASESFYTQRKLKPGWFSSIREHIPVTCFISERVDKVLAYKAKVLERVESVKFRELSPK